MHGLRTLMVMSLAFSLTACSKPTPSSSTQHTGFHSDSELDAKNLTIATADASSSYTTMGQELAELYQSQYQIPVYTKTTQGSVDNLLLLKDKKADLALVMSDTFYDALQGNAEFKHPIHNVLQIAALYPSYIQIITPSQSSIQTLSDLKNKRIAVSAQSSRTETNAKRILASVGLKRNDYKMWYFGHAEAIDAFKNGRIDAAIFSGHIPNQALKQLMHDGFSYKFIGVQDQQVKALQQQHPYFVATHIAANSYGQHTAVPTVAVMHALVVRQDLSQQDVYALTKSFFHHLPRLQQLSPAAQAIDLKQAQQDLVFALHPGAIQYYQHK